MAGRPHRLDSPKFPTVSIMLLTTPQVHRLTKRIATTVTKDCKSIQYKLCDLIACAAWLLRPGSFSSQAVIPPSSEISSNHLTQSSSSASSYDQRCHRAPSSQEDHSSSGFSERLS